MRRIGAVARFWYEFVIGDDWRLAIGTVVALGLTGLLTALGLPAWWITPLGVIFALGVSVAVSRSEHS